MKRVWAGIITAGFMAIGPSPRSVHADDGFSVESFEPGPVLGRSILGVGTADLLGHTDFAFALFGHYQDDPLTVVAGADRDIVRARLVDMRWALDVMAAVGLFDFLQIDLAMPLVLSQSGDDLAALGRPGHDVDGFALGDLRVALRALVLDTRDGGQGTGFALGLAVPFIIPTGDAGKLASDGGFRVRPTLSLDLVIDHYRASLEAGFDLRPDQRFVSYTSDDQLRWALGQRIPLAPDVLSLLAVVTGQIGVGDQPLDSASSHPIEAHGALELTVGGFVVTAGGGAALVRGVGSPDVRAFLALGWTSAGGAPPAPPTDKDGDGLIETDRCPDFAEDPDGYQDTDGCPDPDDDFDGIPDADDKCPREAEDFAGPEDGCPNSDRDGDGVLDGADACVAEPEDKDGDRDDDGCPDLDRDGDGIDAGDQCPDAPEDKDGFQDDDGCPDPDDDGDGVLDAADQCRSAPETKNGFQDDDGCPDTTEKDIVLTADAIQIKQPVFFGFDSDKIRDKSFGILDSVARVLTENAFIKKVSIEGHTDSEGPDAANLDLSTRRAASVLEYLAAKGVDRQRMTSIGFGESQPIQPNTTPAGRAANRRVVFKIVDPAPRAP